MGVTVTSRYRNAPVYPAVDAAGVPRPTVAIRRHRPDPGEPDGRWHRLSGVADIEYLAWRYIGDGEAWWRIADANPVRFPLDLGPGDPLVVPAGGAAEPPRRDRRF